MEVQEMLKKLIEVASQKNVLEKYLYIFKT